MINYSFTYPQINKEIFVNTLINGCGFLILRNIFPKSLISRINNIADDILENEKWDHSSIKGTGERIWNFLEKHALKDVETFCEYYSNDAIHTLSYWWLGPNYQFTSQINNLDCGHGFMPAHFDFPTGILPDKFKKEIPCHQIAINQFHSLQIIVAHTDMTNENGATKVWPGSQLNLPNLVLKSQIELQNAFDENFVSCALNEGDILVMNPSLVHSGGINNTSKKRRVVLHQIASPFSYGIESVNFSLITDKMYGVLVDKILRKEIKLQDAKNVLKIVTKRSIFPIDFDSKTIRTRGLKSEYEIFEQKIEEVLSSTT